MRVASRKSIRNAQTSALNAFQHGLSGSQQRLRLATQSAPEFVQIIKGRNRLVAIENNILHIGGSTTANPESTNSDRVECMVAQARTGTKESDLSIKSAAMNRADPSCFFNTKKRSTAFKPFEGHLNPATETSSKPL